MSFPHKPQPKHAIPRKLELTHFKKVKCGFYAMDKRSVAVRTFVRALSEPDIRNTNPKMELEVQQFRSPESNLFEFTLLDDTVMTYRGDEFNMKRFLVEHEMQKYDLRSRGIQSEMEKDLYKNIDNED